MEIKILDVTTLAKKWSCSEKTIYRKVKQGLIPHFRIGRSVRFRTDLIKLFEKGEIEKCQDLKIKTPSSTKIGLQQNDLKESIMPETLRQLPPRQLAYLQNLKKSQQEN